MNSLTADLDFILHHTQGLWEELRGRRIFITGGTGFFGCWLLESFAWANDHLKLGAQAVVLTRNPEAFRHKAPHLAAHPAIQFHAGDVRNFDFPTGNFSHVIHAATEASAKLNAEQPLVMFDPVVEGARRVLDANLQPQEVVVIGDTPSDVRCGKFIGAKTLAVATGGSRIEELKQHGADWTVADLTQTSARELFSGIN